MTPRQPQHDSLPESPVDWVDVPFGAGQEKLPRGHVQWSPDIGRLPVGEDIRRKPGYESLPVVHRPPTWPA